MPTRNVNLTEHLDHFVETGIHSGRFSNASEVVREALRLLEQREAENQARLDWLRSTTEEAFASLDRGESVPLPSADAASDLVESALKEARAARKATSA